MKLLNRIPNWIRWILVPIASLLSASILYMLFTLFYNVLQYLPPWLFDEDSLRALKFSIIPFMTGWVMVGTGALVAPNNRKTTSIVLGVIYVFLFGISMHTPPQKVGWELISEISLMVGVVFGMIGTNKKLD